MASNSVLRDVNITTQEQGEQFMKALEESENHFAYFKIPEVQSYQTAEDVALVAHGTNMTQMNPVDEFICSECGLVLRDNSEWVYDEDGEYWSCREFEVGFCPRCGMKVDGGSE